MDDLFDTDRKPDANRDPDAILRRVNAEEAETHETRGKLKIFFGYAAGVGKTYAMLEAAHALKRKGVDVAIGYVEPHARAETMALTQGLERIPLKEVEHRGIKLHEFDLDATLLRKPQVVLVDELAHTNSPECRHTKRYRDVEELLRAGINVFTTVNVQHLEGLNDKVAGITNIGVSERIPDSMFDSADSVELIDIEPSDLIERLRTGKVYLPDRAATALANFFSRENLTALREIALRRMADRMTRRSEAEATMRPEAGESVLVVLSPSRGSARVIRTAANLAESLHAELTALVVTPSAEAKRELPDDEKRALRRNVDLAEELGARTVTLYGDDSARLISQYAVTAGITQIVVGAGQDRSKLPWRRTDLAQRLSAVSYGATVLSVPMENSPAGVRTAPTPSAFKPTTADALRAAGAVIISTCLGFAVQFVGFGYSTIPLMYMLAAILIATRADGFLYAGLSAMGSMLAYNFFFTVPRFSFHAYGASASLMFILLLVGTMLASSMTIRAKRQSDETARRAYRTEVLLESSRKLQSATTLDECLELTAGQIMKILDRPVVMYRKLPSGVLSSPRVFDIPGSGGGNASSKKLTEPSEIAVAAWAATNNERAGATTETLRQAQCLYMPIRTKDQVAGVAGLVMESTGQGFAPFEKNLLGAIIDECGQAVGQIILAQEQQEMRMRAERETLRSSLLRAISHDLRTPLTSISGDADVLLQDNGRLTDEQRRQMYRDIHADAGWLIDLVENLLSITRIDDGSVSTKLEPELVCDVVADALRHVNRRITDHVIATDIPDEFVLAKMDARLIMQVIVNLVNNALTYTPKGSHITIAAKRHREEGRNLVRISVSDDGPGISDNDKKRIFDMYYHVPDSAEPAMHAADPADHGSPAMHVNPACESGISEAFRTGHNRSTSEIAAIMSGALGRGDARRGMGLGLPLCRSIVRVHGSEMQVSDASPHGCIFSFDLEETALAEHGSADDPPVTDF